MAGLWIANVIALVVVVPLVVSLANRVIRPAREISGYADEILTHGVGITANLDPLPALSTTAELVGTAKQGAVGYVEALDRVVEARRSR